MLAFVNYKTYGIIISNERSIAIHPSTENRFCLGVTKILSIVLLPVILVEKLVCKQILAAYP